MTNQTNIIRVGLIGAGRMGSFHARLLRHFVKGADLVAIADPNLSNAQKLAKELVISTIYDKPEDLINNPNIDAVVIAVPARFHAQTAIQAAQAGKAVFCEKPMALTLEDADNVIAAAEKANVVLQVGFNRRFAAGFLAAHNEILAGNIGSPQLIRSLTRDPKLNDPAPIPQWTIYYETLIHDFDTILYFNPNAKPISVYAVADALVRPDYKEKGLLDTSVVTIRFDNGAIATAEANFQALYGYDVRAEVFGSKGMVTAGDARQNNMLRFTKDGVSYDTCRMDTELLKDAYQAELTSFIDCIKYRKKPLVGGKEAKAALAIALACIESVKTGQAVNL